MKLFSAHSVILYYSPQGILKYIFIFFMNLIQKLHFNYIIISYNLFKLFQNFLWFITVVLSSLMHNTFQVDEFDILEGNFDFDFDIDKDLESFVESFNLLDFTWKVIYKYFDLISNHTEHV